MENIKLFKLCSPHCLENPFAFKINCFSYSLEIYIIIFIKNPVLIQSKGFI